MIRVDKKAIREKVFSRQNNLDVTENWKTPSGNQRSQPMYEGMIKNTYLGKTKYFKKRSVKEIRIEAQQLLTKWNEQEIKERIKKEADGVWKLNRKRLDEELTAFKTILISTVDKTHRIKWDLELKEPKYKLFDNKPFEHELFDINLTKPRKPRVLKKSFLDLDFIPFFWNNKMKIYEKRLAVWKKKSTTWEKKVKKLNLKKETAKNAWLKEKIVFDIAVKIKNNSILNTKEQYENKSDIGVIEYFRLVFENSVYPDGYNIEYDLT